MRDAGVGGAGVGGVGVGGVGVVGLLALDSVTSKGDEQRRS
jgi:hypothetical protein